MYHMCYRFQKLTRRDEEKGKKGGEEGGKGWFLFFILSKQKQFKYAGNWFESWGMKREIIRPTNSYPRNTFQLQVVSDPFCPHSLCKNLFNYLPLLQSDTIKLY